MVSTKEGLFANDRAPNWTERDLAERRKNDTGNNNPRAHRNCPDSEPVNLQKSERQATVPDEAQ